MAGIANQQIYLGDSDIVYPARIGNLYAAKIFTSADGTAITTLATGAPGYYITAFGYQVDDTSTLAAAGVMDITFSDSSFGVWGNFRLFLPSAFSPKTIPSANRQVNDGPFVWSNKVA